MNAQSYDFAQVQISNFPQVAKELSKSYPKATQKLSKRYQDIKVQNAVTKKQKTWKKR